MIGVVRSTKPGIVVLQFGRGNVGIRGVEMVQHFKSGGVAVADVIVLQRADKFLSKGESSCCRRYLSVLSYSVKSFSAVVNE